LPDFKAFPPGRIDKKKVCVLSKPSKARNTGFHETREIQWKKGEGADYMYTLSDLKKAEHVTHAKRNWDKVAYVQHISIVPSDGRL
jgi:hypothetical protein